MAWNILENHGKPAYWPWYDFDSAVSDMVGDSVYGTYIQLYEDGCRVDRDWNCTAACLDTQVGVERVWNNTLDPNNILTMVRIPILSHT